MALTLNQTPAVVSLGQSPIIFSVTSDSDLANPGFQYVCNLTYWTGNTSTDSGSAYDYQLVKYPNTSQAGIFDLSRILNSTLTASLADNPSNVTYYKANLFYRYLGANNQYVNITGSQIDTNTYRVLDGYGIFQEPIGQDIASSSVYWPLMTDGPATQSCFDTNYGTAGVYIGFTDNLIPTKLVYTSNLGITTDYTLATSTGTTSTQITTYPIGPKESGFPFSTLGLEWFSIQAFNGTTPISSKIKYELVCNQKYPNVRIKWKNRFGQFDYLNFNMVSRNSFQTEKRTYQPQLGTWNASTLSYNQNDTQVQNYIVDSKQSISVNSNWLPESYNEILKQLMVADEIYWVYDEPNFYVRPLTIRTSNIVFKTGVVDHLIQYQFDFDYGQGYKLII
jgi:hypothetical protein